MVVVVVVVLDDAAREENLPSAFAAVILVLVLAVVDEAGGVTGGVMGRRPARERTRSCFALARAMRLKIWLKSALEGGRGPDSPSAAILLKIFSRSVVVCRYESPDS